MALVEKNIRVLKEGYCEGYAAVSRPNGVQSAAMLLGDSLVAFPSWMPKVTFAPPHEGPRGDTLVHIFLRGGADGLNVIIPHGDESYYEHRPTLGVPRPDAVNAEARVVDLDGFFGLHPSLAPLADIYRAGALAPVHATGAPDDTRSHFEAMALMERGATERDYSGWIARHLLTLDTGNDSALRAIAIGDMLPATLTGAVTATALQSIGEYHLNAPDDTGMMQETLQTLYAQRDDLLTAAAQQTFDSIEVLQRVGREQYTPRGRAYPEGDFGRAMQTVAQLIRSEVGVEVASIDLGGWDTHAGQGLGEQGAMPNLMRQLAEGLAAFYEDLADLMDGITVVIMSEFGRRARENAALGTDHGHGNMMMVMGGGINGGKVYADWPGLHRDQLVGPGDLAITTDYRDILAEIIARRLNNPSADAIFPEWSVSGIGLAKPRA